MGLRRTQFFQPFRPLEVPAGSHAVVWEERFSKEEPGFIDKIACDWYEGTHYEWKIDGRLIEKIERSIDVTEPDEYNPPLIALKSCKWTFFNNSTKTFDAGVLCSGYRVRQLV